jgi:hypothetical protein
LFARATKALPGHASLDSSITEVYLLHTPSHQALPSILDQGFDERFAGSNCGTLYGDGTYFAEDVAKTDQYAMCDREWGDSAVKDLHHKLYAQSYPHSGDVFYVLVCRVILGHQVRTDSNLAVQPNVFAGSDGANRRQLAVIPGSKPPTPYHSLLGTHYPRFREFVSFNSTYLYPEYLVAYHRVPPVTKTKPMPPPPARYLRPSADPVTMSDRHIEQLRIKLVQFYQKVRLLLPAPP